jgi:hypothetical protein
MAFGNGSINPSMYGPRGQAYLKATESKSDMGSLQAASNSSETKAVLPKANEADRFDSQLQDDHSNQQQQLKQLRGY